MLEKSQHSYFTSWGWISTWIKSLPAKRGVNLVVGFQNGDPVLAFFIGKRTYNKYGILPSRIGSLNSTGDPYYDSLYIEYNSILMDSAAESSMPELFDYLEGLTLDEFILPGMSSGFIEDGLIPYYKHTEGFQVLLDAVRNSYYVDLDKIRVAGMDYMRLLSSNKRSQIRRSIKQYELDGVVKVEESHSVDDALAMFDEMVAMHQKEWNRRREPGVFSNPYMLQFHQALIRSRFHHNEIQFLKISNASNIIGYLYCFVYRGDVLFYQAGFSYAVDNVYRPGLVSHYYAIVHNAARGMKTYDFLAGEAEYKKSLSTDTVPMYWARWIRGRQRLAIEKNILALKDHIKTQPRLADILLKMSKWLRSIRY